MRHSHIYLCGVALATFGLLLSTSAAAQDEGAPGPDMQDEAPNEMTGNKPGDYNFDDALTPEQQAQFDLWPPDRQFAFAAWPKETRAYFWTLPEKQQDLFWRLSDEDKIALTAMTGPEREAAWQVIEANAAAEGPA